MLFTLTVLILTVGAITNFYIFPLILIVSDLLFNYIAFVITVFATAAWLVLTPGRIHTDNLLLKSTAIKFSKQLAAFCSLIFSYLRNVWSYAMTHTASKEFILKERRLKKRNALPLPLSATSTGGTALFSRMTSMVSLLY